MVSKVKIRIAVFILEIHVKIVQILTLKRG
jgi:hypothetical protein